MYKYEGSGWLKHIDFILIDMLCLFVSFFLSYLLRHRTVDGLFTNKTYLNTGIMLLILDYLVIMLFNVTQGILKRGLFRELVSIVKKNGIVFGFITIYLFSVKDGGELSRIVLWLTLLMHIALCYPAFLVWKSVLEKKRRSGAVRSMLLVSDRGMAAETLRRFRDDPMGEYGITGVVLTDGGCEGELIEGVPVVSGIEDAAKYICREWIDEVYVNASPPPKLLLERCNEMGVTVHRELSGAGEGAQFVEWIEGVPTLTSAMCVATPAQLFLKRALDILGGLVGSLAAVVVILIVGPKIRKASPGPILFRQERIGQNGKRFKMLKIRSMAVDADAQKEMLMRENRVPDGMMFKMDFDPRIIGNEVLPDGTRKTGIGEFIRNTSLDEFPQFFNVLAGQMSLVGTRPPTVDEWEKYEYRHRRRLSIKPGLTGMWQISGRSNVTDFEEVFKLDSEYINNWSFSLDIKILLKTVVNVIRRNGAM